MINPLNKDFTKNAYCPELMAVKELGQQRQKVSVRW